MGKSDEVKRRGLKVYVTNARVWVGNFDVRENEVERTIYIDSNGDKWAWLWGSFYKLTQDARSYYHTV